MSKTKLPLTDLLEPAGNQRSEPLHDLALEPIPSIRAHLIERFDRSTTAAELRALLDDIISLERLLQNVGH